MRNVLTPNVLNVLMPTMRRMQEFGQKPQLGLLLHCCRRTQQAQFVRPVNRKLPLDEEECRVTCQGLSEGNELNLKKLAHSRAA